MALATLNTCERGRGGCHAKTPRTLGCMQVGSGLARTGHRTMCTMSCVSAPMNLPSVEAGLRSNSPAPASCAIACTSCVLPVPATPYNSTARGGRTLGHQHMAQLWVSHAPR